ncbi:hypothetical protein CEXT_62481 [Caerostris extrusa]|uniref:Uncharacterized protein n=1 Tax=Caerostris extrusa TaxID=172846 RepID=A0AAV4M9N2_CAEEX|nr:hypothetical protein CEXT_62481 [Caerostris extrusa]
MDILNACIIKTAYRHYNPSLETQRPISSYSLLNQWPVFLPINIHGLNICITSCYQNFTPPGNGFVFQFCTIFLEASQTGRNDFNRIYGHFKYLHHQSAYRHYNPSLKLESYVIIIFTSKAILSNLCSQYS